MSWQERVKKLMKDQNMNQMQLSQKSGITEASVSRYLNSERSARIDIILNFARALGVTVEYLLSDDESTSIDSYREIATCIARNGDNLTPDEKNKLIAIIIGKAK